MDERELKRQRRKQSNRESARRSRLRKQAECEELGGRVDALSTENITLRAELDRLLLQKIKEPKLELERTGRTVSAIVQLLYEEAAAKP